MEICLRFSLGLILVLTGILAMPAGGQVVFNESFEWGDTGDWTQTTPPRCDVIDTFDRGLTPTVELHVAVGGSDSSGDGTVGNPFASIGRAVQEATPGTAVRVHAGTYSGGNFLANVAGTAVAPIWIGGAPGEPRPVISGSSQGMHLSRAAYVVVHDLEVTGASANGINADDGGDYDNPLAAHHIVFRRLDIHDIGGSGNQDCLKLSGLNHYWVVDSQFEACGGGSSGSGIDHVGCHHGLIARNQFRNHAGNAVQSKGGSEDIEIRWNHFIEGGARSLNMGGSTGFQYFRPSLSEITANAEARDIRLIGNLLEGSDAAVAYVGCVDCVVAHNTIVDPHNWILRILQETTSQGNYQFEACRDGIFVNNLVYYDRSDLSTWVNIGPNTSPGSFTFANNLWYAWDNPNQSEPNLPVAEIDGIYGQDPGLDVDLRIGPGSPASGAGQDSAWTWGDYSGACYSSTPSIGAYESR